MIDDKPPTPTPPTNPSQVPTGGTGDSKPKPAPPITDLVPTGDVGNNSPDVK